MVKNDICLEGASKQNVLFSENVPQKNAPMPLMSRIGPAESIKYSCSHTVYILQTIQSILLSFQTQVHSYLSTFIFFDKDFFDSLFLLVVLLSILVSSV